MLDKTAPEPPIGVESSRPTGAAGDKQSASP